jgi:hypothetical protein
MPNQAVEQQAHRFASAFLLLEWRARSVRTNPVTVDQVQRGPPPIPE